MKTHRRMALAIGLIVLAMGWFAKPGAAWLWDNDRWHVGGEKYVFTYDQEQITVNITGYALPHFTGTWTNQDRTRSGPAEAGWLMFRPGVVELRIYTKDRAPMASYLFKTQSQRTGSGVGLLDGSWYAVPDGSFPRTIIQITNGTVSW